MKLPVVEKLGLILTPKAGHPQQPLGQLRLDALRPAEQHHRRPEKLAIFHEPEATQHLRRIARPGIIRPPAPDGLLQRPGDLHPIQIGHRPAHRWLIFPALIAM